MVARAFATALLLLVAIVAAEEVPARCRAYAVSLLAMAGGLGAGVCVIALNLADLGPGGGGSCTSSRCWAPAVAASAAT